MQTTAFHKILHPTDFSTGDYSAFAHALRMGLAGKSEVTLLHVSDNRPSVHWSDFPPVRETLVRWRYIPENANREMVEATGLLVKKALRSGKNPVAEITRYLEQHPCNLIVLATHQRTGLAAWWQQSIGWKRVGEAMGLVLLLFLGLDGGWFFRCVVRKVTGWSCPGCGGLRAIAAALGGDWFRSLSLNALALPLGLLAGYSLASVVLREVFGCCWFWLPRSKVFWICLSLVVVGFGVLRNLPGFPFPLAD